MNKASEFEKVIVNARCSRNGGLFGMQFEFKNGIWEATNAFVIKEKPPVVTAPRIQSAYPPPQMMPKEMHGTIVVGNDYPGCPYCRNGSFFKCGCGNICCYDGVDKYAYCQWCHTKGRLSGAISSMQGSVQERKNELSYNPGAQPLKAAPPRVENPIPRNNSDVRRLNK